MSYSHAEPGVYENQFPMDSSKWDCAPIPTVGGKETGKQYYEGTGGYLINAKSANAEKTFQVYKEIFANEEYLVGYYRGRIRCEHHPGRAGKGGAERGF